jgi:drug/metabolite transporter (DMT)-like permease
MKVKNVFEGFKSNNWITSSMVKKDLNADRPVTFDSQIIGNVEGKDVDHQKPESVPLTSYGWLGLMFAVFCWGLSFPLLKIALDEIEPITLAVLRYVIGIIPLLILMVLRGGKESLLAPLRNDWRFFFCLGLVGITLPNVLQNYGMTMTSAHLSSIIQASGPVFTIILAVLILKEPLRSNKVLGTVIAISGTFLLVTGGGTGFENSTVLGNFLVLMSAISYAVSSILSKKILEKYDPLAVATVSMLLGTMILAVFMVFESPAKKVPAISLDYWIIVVVLALLPGSLALLIWYKILKTAELSRIILFIYLIPVFATAIAYVWPGEIIELSTILFAFLIVCGVAIAQYERRKKAER